MSLASTSFPPILHSTEPPGRLLFPASDSSTKLPPHTPTPTHRSPTTFDPNPPSTSQSGPSSDVTRSTATQLDVPGTSPYSITIHVPSAAYVPRFLANRIRQNDLSYPEPKCSVAIYHFAQVVDVSCTSPPVVCTTSPRTRHNREPSYHRISPPRRVTIPLPPCSGPSHESSSTRGPYAVMFRGYCVNESSSC